VERALRGVRELPDCIGTFNIIAHGRANPASLGLGITPSYRTGRVTVFGGVFARNHPTTLRKQYDTQVPATDDGDVQNGPFNVLVHAGVEIALTSAVSALVQIHQDLVANPVQYGPAVGVALSGRLGK
jgi:hypothetical protein